MSRLRGAAALAGLLVHCLACESNKDESLASRAEGDEGSKAGSDASAWNPDAGETEVGKEPTPKPGGEGKLPPGNDSAPPNVGGAGAAAGGQSSSPTADAGSVGGGEVDASGGPPDLGTPPGSDSGWRDSCEESASSADAAGCRTSYDCDGRPLEILCAQEGDGSVCECAGREFALTGAQPGDACGRVQAECLASKHPTPTGACEASEPEVVNLDKLCRMSRECSVGDPAADIQVRIKESVRCKEIGLDSYECSCVTAGEEREFRFKGALDLAEGCVQAVERCGVAEVALLSMPQRTCTATGNPETKEPARCSRELHCWQYGRLLDGSGFLTVAEPGHMVTCTAEQPGEYPGDWTCDCDGQGEPLLAEGVRFGDSACNSATAACAERLSSK